jgi:glycyl-tRNA synthetase
VLEEKGIVLDVDARRASIQEQIMQLAKEVGGKVLEDRELMDEVTHLVEKPTALRGQFDASYLDLPEQVLIAVMKTHQRCFPVYKRGKLLPYFIAFRNGGSQHLDIVTQGNEHVIQARFADAAYFVDRDLTQPLEAFLPRLATMTFQTELGSMLDKVARIERLTGVLADQLGLSSAEKENALRVAHLSKADLATQMVVEMTSLQGEMGREYALRSGEPPEVAEGIFEHHLPRFADDIVPQSMAGFIVGLADRLDTLIGLYAAGIKPTGAKDPFAMRRSAIGLVQMLVDREIHFDLHQGLGLAADALPIDVSETALDACLNFIITRHQAQLLNEGHAYDIVEAILGAQGQNPTGATIGVNALEKWVTREDWLEILHAFARCARITRGEPQLYPLNPEELKEPQSLKLYDSLIKAESRAREPGSADDFLEAFEPLVPVINTFFDEVLVMTEDRALRNNRLGLLQRVVALADGVMDLSKLEGF